MASSHTLEVLEVCQISPPPGSAPTTFLPLTCFDIPFMAWTPVKRLFFYKFHHPKTHFMDTTLPNIKHSLSLTLQYFYHLAGNLTWPQESTVPELFFKEGDTVPLTVAESDYDFYQLSGNHPRDATIFYPLIPKLKPVSSGEKCVPLLALQVTLFEDIGICIGITIYHVASDGRTSNHFMKSWASICRLGGDTSLMRDSLPFYDRSLFKYLKPLEIKLSNEMANLKLTKETFYSSLKKHDVVPIGKVRATFVLSSSDIKALKQQVSAHVEKESQIGKPLHLSSLVVTCAYVWVCLIKARLGETDDSEATEHFIVPVDVRRRLDPPLPITYFGNGISGFLVMAKRSELTGEDGIAAAAKLIGIGVQNFDINGLVDQSLSYFMSLPPERVECLSSSPKFGVYETDFGWGRPEKVEMGSIDNRQAMCISECPDDEGGLAIGLVRKKIEMEAFSYLFANSLK